LIHPVLLHDSETRVLTKRKENRLLVFTGTGTVWNDWEFNSPNVIGAGGVVKSNRLRYAGHMIRGAEDLLQIALFRAVPGGRQTKPKKKRWMA
jgi:hypothetical protein